jgi:hypothetical protein
MGGPGFESRQGPEIFYSRKLFSLSETGYQDSFPRVRQSEGLDHSPRSSAHVKNEWRYASTPPGT